MYAPLCSGSGASNCMVCATAINGMDNSFPTQNPHKKTGAASNGAGWEVSVRV
jgi:hypothetical protein